MQKINKITLLCCALLLATGCQQASPDKDAPVKPRDATNQASVNKFAGCVPVNTLTTLIDTASRSNPSTPKISVLEKLESLHASCNNGKLTDDKNNEIVVFTRASNCGGTPQLDPDAYGRNGTDPKPNTIFIALPSKPCPADSLLIP